MIIYENNKIVHILSSLITEFEDVFIDIENIINISENQWMFISLKSEIKTKSLKVYSLDHKNKEVVDVIFDKL